MKPYPTDGPGLPAWITDPERAFDVGREASLFAAAPGLAAAYVEALAPLWHIGDGTGGWLLDLIVKAAAERGLDLPASAPRARPVVALIADRDGGYLCHYCGCALVGHPLIPLPQVDHKHPRALGGGDELANLVLACPPCNSAKGATPYAAFVAELNG